MERLLPRCLDSFIISNDLMNKIEVLVVNDGSKDRSSEIAHKYAEKYPNTFTVIDKPNGNYGSCINAGLKVATGKYLRICDADDQYKNANFEEYIKFLSTIDSDIVFSPYETYCEDKLESSFEVPGELCNHTWSIDELDWGNKELLKFRAMHCMATKREILTKNNYYQTEGISYTDTQFIFYSVLYAETCCFFKDIIYIYYLGRDGQTMSKESIIKSHMHFYENANRMLNDYMKVESRITQNRAQLLIATIVTCIVYYIAVVIYYIPASKEKMNLLTSITGRIEKCKYQKKFATLLSNEKFSKLWYRYKIPPAFLRFIYKIKTAISPS